jgi:hypothetical protein
MLGVDLTEQIFPFFKEKLQGAIFLLLQYFIFAAISIGLKVFINLLPNEIHAINTTTLRLFLM